jgi:ribosomal-protein-serine acetyltransferase
MDLTGSSDMQVQIRPYQSGDVDPFFEAAQESVQEVYPWLPWCHPAYTRAEAGEWVERQIRAWEQGEEFEFCIVDPAGQLLGGCGLNQINSAHRFANVGYWVRSRAAGRGVASAAVDELIRFAREETELLRLEIVVAIENRASVRVAEKVGASLEGTLRNRLFLHRQAHDAYLYAVVVPR